MRTPRDFTAIISKEERWYVARCPELDITSQGKTIESAKANLIEAIEGFLLVASPKEIRERLQSDVYVTRLRVAGA